MHQILCLPEHQSKLEFQEACCLDLLRSVCRMCRTFLLIHSVLTTYCFYLNNNSSFSHQKSSTLLSLKCHPLGKVSPCQHSTALKESHNNSQLQQGKWAYKSYADLMSDILCLDNFTWKLYFSLLYKVSSENNSFICIKHEVSKIIADYKNDPDINIHKQLHCID